MNQVLKHADARIWANQREHVPDITEARAQLLGFMVSKLVARAKINDCTDNLRDQVVITPKSHGGLAYMTYMYRALQDTKILILGCLDATAALPSYIQASTVGQ
jgi:hypothetical protein